MSLEKLNPAALYAMGMDRVTVEALRHILRQAGDIKNAITLPEVASDTDSLTPIVSSHTILIAAAQVALAVLEAEQENLPAPNNDLIRRLDDMQAQAERASIERAGLLRTIDDLQASAEQLNFNLAAIVQRIETLENGVA